jgi:HAD superfamily 5'-nucleotidase-like hydrolase
MHPNPHPGPVVVIRPLNLAHLDAVGFDLDHTLALYDDHALNLLAAAETIELLRRQKGYPADWLRLAGDPLPAARGLSLDLRHGNVVKIGADRVVRLARRGEVWLDEAEIRARYRDPDPADEETIWHIHSPFDVPTLWFFAALAPRLGAAAARETVSAPVARALRDIRTMLDHSHTRGALKASIGQDLGRYVSPAGRVREGLERWGSAGKRLFVVTNSDRAFATAVLDRVVGPAWRDLFALVVTDADKPAFFTAPPARGNAADRLPRDGGARVLSGASATEVERLIGVERHRVLYAGDNARCDIAPARRHGWRTAHVAAEFAGSRDDPVWGGALEHRGEPTWFAAVIREHADLVCARVDGLLDLDPHGALENGEDFFARLARGEAP